MSDHDPETGEIYDTVVLAPSMPVAIIKARLAVMRAAKGVGKTGRNKFHGYDYASDEDVLGLLQPLMADNGLLLEMRPTSIDFDEDGNARVGFDMVWMHESGAVAPPIPWWGIASDRDTKGKMQDKWFNKAATACEKYFLLKQFHIPAGKAADPDASETAPGNKPAPKPEPKRETVDHPITSPRSLVVPDFGPDKKGAWSKWCMDFRMHLSLATPDETEEWLLQNGPQLDGLKAFNAKWHEALMSDVRKHQETVEAESRQLESENPNPNG